MKEWPLSEWIAGEGQMKEPEHEQLESVWGAEAEYDEAQRSHQERHYGNPRYMACGCTVSPGAQEEITKWRDRAQALRDLLAMLENRYGADWAEGHIDMVAEWINPINASRR